MEWERKARRKWKSEAFRNELERWKDKTVEMFQSAHSFVKISLDKVINQIVGSTHEHIVHEIARIFSRYSSPIYGHFLRKTAIGCQVNYSRYKPLWDKEDAYARGITHDFEIAVSHAFLKAREVRDLDRSFTEDDVVDYFSND
jgi:hypothetical protein